MGENLRNLKVRLKYGLPGHYLEEDIQWIAPRYLKVTAAQGLLLIPLLQHLDQEYLLTRDYMVSCFSPSRDVYVFQGQTPLSEDLQVDLKELGPDHVLKLKVRYNSPAPGFDQEAERSKEWKIGHIIEKIAKWRSLCSHWPKEEIPQKSLEECAAAVGMPKKTIDDYLLQLRLGRKFGFNFEEHKHERITVLRTFVKKFRKVQNEVLKLLPGEPLPAELVSLVKDQGNCKVKNCCLPTPGTFSACPALEQLLKELSNAE